MMNRVLHTVSSNCCGNIEKPDRNARKGAWHGYYGAALQQEGKVNRGLPGAAWHVSCHGVCVKLWVCSVTFRKRNEVPWPHPCTCSLPGQYQCSLSCGYVLWATRGTGNWTGKQSGQLGIIGIGCTMITTHQVLSLYLKYTIWTDNKISCDCTIESTVWLEVRSECVLLWPLLEGE